MRIRRHLRHARHQRRSANAFTYVDWLFAVPPYLNLNLFSPCDINVFATTGAPVRIERWVLPPAAFIHPNGFLVDAGLHPLYPRAWSSPVEDL